MEERRAREEAVHGKGSNLTPTAHLMLRLVPVYPLHRLLNFYLRSRLGSQGEETSLKELLPQKHTKSSTKTPPALLLKPEEQETYIVSINFSEMVIGSMNCVACPIAHNFNGRTNDIKNRIAVQMVVPEFSPTFIHQLLYCISPIA
nr:hypothetical protein Itr_chr01CG14400 [Ipomoea trifida]